MSIWVYKRTEPQVYTVGFFDPLGKFQTDSDHESREMAAKRANYLNGGTKTDKIDFVRWLIGFEAYPGYDRNDPVHIATRACDSGIITAQERDRLLVALEQ